LSVGATSRVPRYLLGGLLAFVALNAFAGGFYGLTGAKDVPREWLSDSPFRSYFIPSLVLFIVVGGGVLAASIAVFARARSARTCAVLAGVLLLGWVRVQVAIIGYVSWMQPATAIAGVVIILLAVWLAPRR
jgi:hypothetical protein